MPAPVPPEVKEAALDAVRAAFTEERTDAFIAKLTARLPWPWWTKFIPVGQVLDQLLPDVLIDFLEEVL